jgi:SAM-dependent methyltransferase
MKQIEWINDKEFVVAGVKFRCSLGDHSLVTDEQRIVLLKDKFVLDNYREVFRDTQPKNFLEFGIYQGGSPALFSLLFDCEKFVGIDIRPPVAGFAAFCSRHPVGQKIRIHYGVNQIDESRIDAILRDEFGDAPVDVIVDDASHAYAHTRRTFEIAFPRLRPGGVYVVEDWGWAHWPGPEAYPGKPAMSLLIMELVMMCASRSDLVSEVRVFPSFAFIRKAATAPHIDTLSLDSIYKHRGLEIFSVERKAPLGLNMLGREVRTRIVPPPESTDNTTRDNHFRM